MGLIRHSAKSPKLTRLLNQTPRLRKTSANALRGRSERWSDSDLAGELALGELDPAVIVENLLSLRLLQLLGSAGLPRGCPSGQIGFGYTVWASTNHNQWTVAGTPNENGPANFQFSDFQTANVPHRYYRLSRP